MALGPCPTWYLPRTPVWGLVVTRQLGYGEGTMSQLCPDSETIDGMWRLKLAEAERRYIESRTRENRVEFVKVLSIFTALVMRGEIPREVRLPFSPRFP